MKRVLMIALTPPEEGGSQQAVEEVSKRMEDNECSVLTQEGSICRNKIELKCGAKNEFLRNIMFALMVYWYSLSLMFGKKRYDIIHIHENLLYFLACNPILQIRYKIVITVHGLKGFKFYDSPFLWFFFGFALSCADKVITVNIADKERIDMTINKKSWIHIPSIYIPNGVDTTMYTQNVSIGNKIVYIGRIHRQKGIDILLEAKDNHLLEVIGDTNSTYFNSLKGYLNVIWDGKIIDRQKIANILKSAYMIVLPSRFEGLPLTLFESLASGRPVIVSDIDAFKSVIKNDECLFFRSEDASDLRDKILYLESNPDAAEYYGRKGKELSNSYDWKVITDKTKDLYMDMFK